MSRQKLFPADETAACLGMTETDLWQKVFAGELKPCQLRTGARAYWSEAALDAMIGRQAEGWPLIDGIHKDTRCMMAARFHLDRLASVSSPA